MQQGCAAAGAAAARDGCRGGGEQGGARQGYRGGRGDARQQSATRGFRNHRTVASSSTAQILTGSSQLPQSRNISNEILSTQRMI